MTMLQLLQTPSLSESGAGPRATASHRGAGLLKLALATTLALGAPLFAVNAYAGSANSNLGVSAAVADGCTISSLAVAFGTYDTIGVNATTPKTAEGSVTVQCTSGASALVVLGQGVNAVGDVPVTPVRQMASGLNRLGYSLFTLGDYATVWGSTGVAATADGASHIMTVWGRIPAGQNVLAGTYADTVVATVTF